MWVRSPIKNWHFFGTFILSISDPFAIMLSWISISVFILQSLITIELSILHFFIIQLSPMLAYGPIFVESIIQLSPIMTGPIMLLSGDMDVFFPIII